MANRQLYYPVERALLCDYFGMSRPETLQSLDIWAPDPRATRKAVHLEADRFGNLHNERALHNAVARLALSRIQDRLPHWYASRGETFIAGREEFETAGDGVLLMPLHLFTINWADSGPGYSWPEAYHVTWFPEFDRYVVTASDDSPDIWGFEDLAIGHFGQGEGRIQGARRIITTFWREECNGGDTRPWAYLFDTGAVDEAEAYAWAADVWPQAEDDQGEEV
jgi:hypothetical protein